MSGCCAHPQYLAQEPDIFVYSTVLWDITVCCIFCMSGCCAHPQYLAQEPDIFVYSTVLWDITVCCIFCMSGCCAHPQYLAQKPDIFVYITVLWDTRSVVSAPLSPTGKGSAFMRIFKLLLGQCCSPLQSYRLLINSSK